ncbi:MAG TPA: hypothetical protein PLN31_05885 [Azoarcus taiwanensis]|nr:hypothetical protein [Azoarcus taiwanensis]
MKMTLVAAALLTITASASAQISIPVQVRDAQGNTVSGVTYSISGSSVVLSLPNSSGGGTTAPTPTDPTPTDPTPTDPTPTDPPPSDASCGATPSGVTIVDTGSASKSYARTLFRPGAKDIIAFKFTVPASGTTIGEVRATTTSSAPLTKLLSISSCPGDYKNPIPSSTWCQGFSTEVSNVVFSTRAADSRFMCVLEPGKTYYANAVAVQKLSDTAYTCSSTSNCGFYLQRDKF